MAKDDGDEDAKVAVDDGAMFVGGSENTSDTKKSGTSDSPKDSDKKNEAKTGADKKPEKKFEKKFEKSSSAKEISGANMTMTLISCTEEALMMRRWLLKRLTVLSVRLQ